MKILIPNFSCLTTLCLFSEIRAKLGTYLKGNKTIRKYIERFNVKVKFQYYTTTSGSYVSTGNVIFSRFFLSFFLIGYTHFNSINSFRV